MISTRSTFPGIAVCALLLSGCSGALLGNLLVLGVAVAIFFGTLGLGRGSSTASRSTSGSQDRSTADQPRS